MNIQRNFERTVNRTINRETRKIKESVVNEKPYIPSNIAYRIMQEALFNIKANILMIDANTYLIEVDIYLPENIMENLENMEKDRYTISVVRNEKDYNTKIMIYDNSKERSL